MPEATERDELPQATVQPGRRTRVSMVWTIPVLAALVALGLAIQAILQEGPTITIVFPAAAGLEAGKTFVKYKDVNIGQVTAVQLTPDYSRVEVSAKIAKSAEGLMVEDARFWVVEPRVTLSGVSGLGTLLSGNYIGFEAGHSDRKERRFVGLETAPVVTGGQPGRQFRLRAEKLGSLGVGAPIYYRSLQAGQVIAHSLADDGKAVDVTVFVNAPYDRYVNPGTRFWNASGIEVSAGAGGVEVRTESLVALLAGGLAFDTPAFAPADEPAAPNTVFTLYDDRATAMKQPEALAKHFVLYFTESLRGLSVGAPVTILGLEAGQVTDIGLDVDAETMNVRGRVEIVAYPERILARVRTEKSALAEAMVNSEEKRHRLLGRMVEYLGLRGRLQSGNLLTGQLYVAFDYHPDAPEAKVDWRQEKPVLPVVPSTLPNLEARLGSILAKLDALPYETIGSDLTKVLASTDKLIRDADRLVAQADAKTLPELTATLDGAKRTLATANGVLKNADATLLGKDAPGQHELREVLQEVARAARSVRVLTDYLERHPEALLRGKTEGRP